MNNDIKKKRICLLLSESVVNDFRKKSRSTGIKQNYVIEALLKNWVSKPINIGVGEVK